MNSQSDTTGRLGDVGTNLEGVIYPINAILFHANEEAGGELRMAGTCVEEGGGGVGEPALRHEVVCLWREAWLTVIYGTVSQIL